MAFYLDGVSFVHKSNPMKEATSPLARLWRKRNEGLSLTAKGSKDLAGGRRLHLNFSKGEENAIAAWHSTERNPASFSRISLNPIENVFHIVKRQLREDAKLKRIERETWNEFVTRVKLTIQNTPISYIDKTIESMPNRIKEIIKSKGRRIKY